MGVIELDLLSSSGVCQRRAKKIFLSPTAFAVHTDTDAVVLQLLDEFAAGERAALVSAKDVGQRANCLQGCQVSRQRVG